MPVQPFKNFRAVNKDTGAYLATDGNSIVSVAVFPVTTSLTPTLDVGFINWMQAFSRHSLRWLENRAVSGATALQQKALLSTWVPSTKANQLLFLEGINSIAGYVTAGEAESNAARLAFADTVSYLNAARSYGKFRRIFLCTTPPRNLTAARNAAHDLYNRLIRDLCATDGHYVLIDIWKAVVDPTNSTSFAKANYLQADNLHPTAKGARAMGYAAASVINDLNFPASNLIASSAVVRSANATGLYINSNPMLLGTPAGGAQLVNGATGLVAPGWRAGVTSGTMTAVASVVADSDGIGNAQRLTVTGAGSGSIAQIGINTTEAIPFQVANDYFKAMAKVRWSGATNVSAIYARVIANTNAQYTVDGLRDGGTTVAPSAYENSDMVDEFFLTTPAVKFPGNVAATVTLAVNFYILFGAAGGAVTIDVSRGGLINLGQTPGEV